MSESSFSQEVEFRDVSVDGDADEDSHEVSHY